MHVRKKYFIFHLFTSSQNHQFVHIFRQLQAIITCVLFRKYIYIYITCIFSIFFCNTILNKVHLTKYNHTSHIKRVGIQQLNTILDSMLWSSATVSLSLSSFLKEVRYLFSHSTIPRLQFSIFSSKSANVAESGVQDPVQ